MNLTPLLIETLQDFEVFSEHMIGRKLREYQVAPYAAVLASILGKSGDDFLWIFPRQSGKNEALAHLLTYLLNLFQLKGGNMVFAAVGDGIGRGLQRLDDLLDNPLNRGHWRKVSRPLGRQLGRSRVVCISSHPQAHARGETAHLLLAVDELQEQDPLYLEKVFTPMRAAHNATWLGLGTTRTTADALWSKKTLLEEMTARDGKQRVFMVTPEAVIRENPDYGEFLSKQIRVYGRNHPVIKSEYFLEPIDGEGGLFPDRRRRMMQGGHARQLRPRAGCTYVATVDFAGQDEAATEPGRALSFQGRDSTVCYIFQVVGDGKRPAYHAVDVFVDTGSRHFHASAGSRPLTERLLAFLGQWRVAHVVADETGVGEGVTDWLRLKLPGRVTGYKFTKGGAKAQLGSWFLTVIETGRFHYWSAGYQVEDPEWQFWEQVRHCAYTLPVGGTLNRDMRWGVHAGTRVEGLNGAVWLHDDHLLAAALVAVYDGLFASSAIRTGTARSAVIPPRDIFEDDR